MIPNISPIVVAQAKQVWDEAIDKYGQMVDLYAADDTMLGGIRALCKRPKILGLFDRTQSSYDQERYFVMVKAGDVADPHKFMRARWDEEDHVFISVTKVMLGDTVFGYRILVKG